MVARRCWLASVVGLLFAGPVGGDDPPSSKAPDAKQVGRWVQQLNDDEFAVREAAIVGLARAGTVALPALTIAARNGPLEVRVRATQVLTAWYERADKDAVDSVEDVLEALVDSGGTVGDQAKIAWEQQERPREQRCLAHIERLGGRVQYRDDRFGVDREDLLSGRKIPLHVAITAKWTGGDAGLKYLCRIRPRETLPLTVYRVNGNAVSDRAFESLEDAGIRVEKRGAKLGVTNNPTFDPAADNVAGFRIGPPAAESAAEKGGLQVDDIIVAFGGKPIANFNDLVSLLLETKPGEKVEFTVLREQKGERVSHRLTVELGDW